MINILMSRSSNLIAPFAKNTLKKFIVKNTKVAILGFSFFGDLSDTEYTLTYGSESLYQENIRNIFKEYEITDINWVYYYNMSKEESIKIIKEADILYFPGGAPDLMMKRIIERELLDVIRAFDKIVIGSSAGAMIQLKEYHISKDNEYKKFSILEGLGFIDEFFIEVHYRRRVAQKSSIGKMNRTYKKPIYTIPDDGMLVVIDNINILTLGNSKKYYGKNGKIKRN